VIKAIIELAEKAAKEPREVKVVDESASSKGNARADRAGAALGLRIPVKAGPLRAVGKAQRKR